MPGQTLTRAVESDREPQEIYEVLAEVRNIPQWAPVFADTIQRLDDTHWIVTKGGENFRLEAILHPAAGTADYVREMGNNLRGGACLRVIPRPLGGSTVTMTVPLGPGARETEVGRTVEQELAQLVRLARSRR
ncbi:MAG: hypothetical protein WA399_08475 [Acidobacteriaceae bacterium]